MKKGWKRNRKLFCTGILILGGLAVGGLAAVKEQMNQRQLKHGDQKGQHVFYGPYEKYIKRPLDAILASFALVVLSPVIAATAFLVRIKLGSPVLFIQERPGLNEKIFQLYKFRTMTNETDEEGNLLPDGERLTRFGKILRSTSLDELPELLNILKGDMAVIGPRPLLVKYLDRYTLEQHRRHSVRPGLTGLAMSRVRNRAGWDKKFELDLEYVDHVSFLLDMKILFWTMRIVLKREGINEAGEATNSEFMGILEAE